jgi:hypothetical protein
MKKIAGIVILFIMSTSVIAQNELKNLYPNKIFKIDLSIKKEKALKRRDFLIESSNLSIYERAELDSLLNAYDETVENIWEVIGGGCSWYCGGGNYKVKASSFHLDYTTNYPPERANDNSYKTAWVVSKNNGGIGEHIEYYFKNQSPRVTEIIISNGYVKNQSVWTKNNRVKKLKLYINGLEYAILNLEDSRTDQAFQFSPLGKNKDGSDLVLRFEIIEIYKGTEFNHTAITEIYFDGIDVH